VAIKTPFFYMLGVQMLSPDSSTA